jgi:peptidoglycan/LPS O-acetylase OafA/YrhL
MIRHSFNAVALPVGLQQAIVESPLALLLNGQGAVQLFFVLSGYVLAGSLSRNRRWIDLIQFYVKRVFRIYPPYAAALITTWCASFLYSDPSAAISPWLRAFAGVNLDSSRLLASFVFPGTAFGQLPIGWTLYIEMIYSLLLPALFLIARRVHWAALIVASLYCLSIESVSVVLLYALHFSLGIAAFLERDRIGRWIERISPPVAAAGAVVALLVYCAPLLLGWSTPVFGIVVSGSDPASLVLMAAGSLGLIVSAIFVPWMRCALSTRPVLFLGRISFSLYLLHFMVLILCARSVKEPSSVGDVLLLLALVAGISIPLSALFHHWVERTAILSGNRVCAWLAHRLQTRALQSEPP